MFVLLRPQVLQYLKDLISRETLYDEANKVIILCNAELEDALDMKALHLTEIR
jgi:hypothetical protein